MSEKYFKIYPENYTTLNEFKDSATYLFINYHLMKNGGNKTKTAESLDINRLTIYNILKPKPAHSFAEENTVHPYIPNRYYIPISNKNVTIPVLDDKDAEYKMMATAYAGYLIAEYEYTISDIVNIRELIVRFRAIGEDEKVEDLEELLHEIYSEVNI